MRKIISVMIVLAVFLIANAAFAKTVWIGGYIRNADDRPISGAKVTWEFITGDKTVYTDAEGLYVVGNDRNWCGTKKVTISNAGCLPRVYHVRDDSCCDCTGSCVPPQTPDTTCGGWIHKDFNLLCFDSDNDGYYNHEDNCLSVPNGPVKGTCFGGVDEGDDCFVPNACRGSCGAFCSLDQEDKDGDGIGDVCDDTPNQANSANVQESSIVSPARLSEKINTLYALTVWLFPAWYCRAQGGCNYDCIEQVIADFLNGRDAFLGKWIYPDGKQPLPECPDIRPLQQAILDFRDWLFNIFYGGNFIDEE